MPLDLTYADTADRITKVKKSRKTQQRLIMVAVFLLLFASAFGVFYPTPIHTY